MATLITGSTGFVISNVVREFAERGHTVVALDVVAPNEMVERYLAPWAEQITWVQADILDPVALEQMASAHSITRIVHGAAITPGQEAIERAESRRTIDINLTGTANMLELAVRVGAQRLVYISSGAVYEGIDPPDGLLHEDLPLHPRRLYSVTKFASECLARRYSELYGFETASVRLGGPYGPMERVTGHRTNMSQLQQWTGKSLRGESIVMEPQGARDYTYVGDIAAGIRTILDAPALPHDVYNLASGVGGVSRGVGRSVPVCRPGRHVRGARPCNRRSPRRARSPVTAGHVPHTRRSGIPAAIRPGFGPARVPSLAQRLRVHCLKAPATGGSPPRPSATGQPWPG